MPNEGLSEETLLPCPFCGGSAEIVQIGNEATPKRGFEVRCLTWGCSTKKRAMVIRHPLADARRFAIAAWNRRPPTPDEREAIARIIALAGLGTTTGDGRWMPPNDKWDLAEWQRRVLECVPGDVERRCYETADAILARRGPAPAGVGLAKFFQWAMDRTWEGCTLDGADTQGMALSLHLIREVPYDPEEHGPNDVGVEQGDPWFVFSPEVSALTKGAEHG